MSPSYPTTSHSVLQLSFGITKLQVLQDILEPSNNGTRTGQLDCKMNCFYVVFSAVYFLMGVHCHVRHEVTKGRQLISAHMRSMFQVTQFERSSWTCVIAKSLQKLPIGRGFCCSTAVHMQMKAEGKDKEQVKRAVKSSSGLVK